MAEKATDSSLIGKFTQLGKDDIVKILELAKAAAGIES